MKDWLQAFRLRTLPLAVSSIAMGGFLAASRHAFHWPVFILSVLTTIFLQVLSNLANDYGDYQNGADSIHRIGPARAVQSGSISPAAMRKGIALFIALSLISGISLVFIGVGFNVRFALFLFLGILAILAALKYTAGKNPYGYLGLGDISVFLFFGLLGVIGNFYLNAGYITSDLLLPASACGLFSVAVLNINNMRDINSDALAGKNSIPVRIGIKNAKLYHFFLLACGVLCAIGYAAIHFASPVGFSFLVALPLFFLNAYKISRSDPSEMDPYLKQMAMSTLVFVLSFGIGLIYS